MLAHQNRKVALEPSESAAMAPRYSRGRTASSGIKVTADFPALFICWCLLSTVLVVISLTTRQCNPGTGKEE